MKFIGLNEVDDLLQRATDLREDGGGFTGWWDFLSDYWLEYDAGVLPDDPFSPEYRETQLELYRAIAGVADYQPRVNEVMSIDIEACLRQPAPFDAGSTASAGEHLIAYGFLCRLLDLQPGARVIEYGAGQGNISMLLATIGLDVTAIDISPDYIELIRRRAARDGVELHAVVGEFGDPPPDGQPVDAILFYEAFHHSFDHVALVRAMRRNLTANGRVLFAGEPILETPAQPWVGPWGVRIDGVSLNAIRQHQCFELGFSASYFVRMLMQNGFLVTFHECAESWIGNTWIARLNDGLIAPNRLKLPPDEELTWGAGDAEPEQPYRFAGPATRLTLDEDIRWRAAKVTLHNRLSVKLAATVSVGSSSRAIVLDPGQRQVVALALPRGPRTLLIESETTSPAELGVNDDLTRIGLAVAEIQLEG